MRFFLLNLLIALLWMMMWGSYDVYTLLGGVVVGYLLLGLISRASGMTNYGARVWKLLFYLAYFIKILVIANLQVAWEIITPKFGMSPRIIRYDVAGMTPVQITTLANSITLTPGTLSADISDDGHYLFVHCMYAGDREKAVQGLDELRDRILQEVFA